MTNVSHSGNNHKGARSSSRPYINCNVSSVNEYDKAADLSNRLKLFLSRSSSICNDLADDGKLGYGFTSADELEEVNIGPRDKSWPTFISKKVRPVPTRADDSLTEGVLRLFCLGLHGDAWIGQKHHRTSAPSQERILAISAMSASNEDRSLRRG
jgi:hypothetical protein